MPQKQPAPNVALAMFVSCRCAEAPSAVPDVVLHFTSAEGLFYFCSPSVKRGRAGDLPVTAFSPASKFRYCYLRCLLAQTRASLGGLFSFGEKRLDLFGMVQIVACCQARDVFDRLLAAFGVDTVIRPLLGRERSEEIEIG